MTEQIIQILERDECAPGPSTWKVRTAIQLLPNIPEERERLRRFVDAVPGEHDRQVKIEVLNQFADFCGDGINPQMWRFRTNEGLF